MHKDITVAVKVGGAEYQARLRKMDVQVYRNTALVGSALWHDGQLLERAETIPDEVYEVIQSTLVQAIHNVN